jgi:hypothetical protein
MWFIGNLKKISQFVSLSHKETQFVKHDVGRLIHEIRMQKIRENAQLQFSGTRPSPKGLQTLLGQASKGTGSRDFFLFSSCVWGNKLQFWPKRPLFLIKRGQNKHSVPIFILGIGAQLRPCHYILIKDKMKIHLNRENMRTYLRELHIS